MRYTLFVCDSNTSRQLRSSEDLELLKRDADACQKEATSVDPNTDLEYFVNVGHKTIYNAAIDFKNYQC